MNRTLLTAALLFTGAFPIQADVIVTPTDRAVTPPADVVVVPTRAASPPSTVIVTTPDDQIATLDREGDWYVVYGTADLDRYHTLLRVKSEKHGVITIAYRDGVEIYRRGQHISYSDVNPGDTVTVRFKNG